jgi:hypothetical protein
VRCNGWSRRRDQCNKLSCNHTHLLHGTQALEGFFTSPFSMLKVLSASPIVLAISTSLLSAAFPDLLLDRLTQTQMVAVSESTNTTKTTAIAALAPELRFTLDFAAVLCVVVEGPSKVSGELEESL